MTHPTSAVGVVISFASSPVPPANRIFSSSAPPDLLVHRCCPRSPAVTDLLVFTRTPSRPFPLRTHTPPTVMREALAAGGEPDWVDGGRRDGFTAMIKAARAGQCRMVQLLLEVRCTCGDADSVLMASRCFLYAVFLLPSCRVCGSFMPSLYMAPSLPLPKGVLSLASLFP